MQNFKPATINNLTLAEYLRYFASDALKELVSRHTEEHRNEISNLNRCITDTQQAINDAADCLHELKGQYEKAIQLKDWNELADLPNQLTVLEDSLAELF